MDSSTTNITALLLRRPEFDDIAFLGVVLLLSICYSLKGIAWARPDPHHHLWFEKPQSDIVSSKSKETRDIGLKLEQSVRLINPLLLLLSKT